MCLLGFIKQDGQSGTYNVQVLNCTGKESLATHGLLIGVRSKAWYM